MREPNTHEVINRILVALDPCRQNPAALEQALTLAKRLQAELVALFVEDAELLQAADLPITREVQLSSAAVHSLDATGLARRFRQQTRRLQQSLSRSAEQRQVRASIKVVRGRFMIEAMAAAVETDVLFLNVLDRPSAKRSGLGEALTTTSRPVWVFYDGSPGAARALTLAAELSRLGGSELALLLPTLSSQRISELCQDAAHRLGVVSTSLQALVVSTDDGRQLHSVLRRYGCSLLVLQRGHPLLQTPGSQALLAELEWPLVLAH